MTNLAKNQGSLQPWKGFFDTDDFFRDFWSTKMITNFPAVNASETENVFIVEVAAPGFKKDHFKISVDRGLLKICAEMMAEEKEEVKEFTRREFSFNAFERSFHLPENVKEDNISAVYENGILKLTLPKAENKPNTTKAIAVS